MQGMEERGFISESYVLACSKNAVHVERGEVVFWSVCTMRMALKKVNKKAGHVCRSHRSGLIVIPCQNLNFIQMCLLTARQDKFIQFSLITSRQILSIITSAHELTPVASCKYHWNLSLFFYWSCLTISTPFFLILILLCLSPLINNIFSFLGWFSTTTATCCTCYSINKP